MDDFGLTLCGKNCIAHERDSHDRDLPHIFPDLSPAASPRSEGRRILSPQDPAVQVFHNAASCLAAYPLDAWQLRRDLIGSRMVVASVHTDDRHGNLFWPSTS
ncbi:hypothetical protein [Novosphingobium resinovorum]|uniref:hypothetical protein n=1 Tax=Novosphingobium resinovorum TaxID=158500 RepID=UPI002ED09EC9